LFIQEMPGDDFFGASLQAAVEAGEISSTTIDDSVLRVLTPMFAVGLFDESNEGDLSRDVRTQEHLQVAREVAAASQVLLKNEGNLLPLPKGRTAKDGEPFKIALFGGGARSPIVGGGGSGSVFPSHIVSPYEGIMAALGIMDNYPVTYSCADALTNSSTLLQDVGISQWGCESRPAASLEECCEACGAFQLCEAFTYDAGSGSCGLYPTSDQKRPAPGKVTGECRKTLPPPEWQCSEAGGVCVAVVDGTDLDAVSKLAAEADVGIAVVGSFAKEGSDRQSLSFDTTTGGDCQVAPPNQDAMIPLIAAQVPTVVAMTAGGAALTPWRQDVQSIIHGFFPGEQYGHALADVLFGAVSPTGRLPVTMPNAENEVGFTRQEYPGVKYEAHYNEHMYIDYRW
jgi:beta-glucosidase